MFWIVFSGAAVSKGKRAKSRRRKTRLQYTVGRGRFPAALAPHGIAVLALEALVEGGWKGFALACGAFAWE